MIYQSVLPPISQQDLLNKAFLVKKGHCFSSFQGLQSPVFYNVKIIAPTRILPSCAQFIICNIFLSVSQLVVHFYGILPNG